MKLEVKRDCNLKSFIEEQCLTFQSGAAFYEFTRAEEDISFMKEIILMDKVYTLYIPYSWKYWRELNLVVGPQITIAKILADLNLVFR